MKMIAQGLIRSALLIGVLALSLSSCKSKKNVTPIEKSTGAVEITVPFSSKEFYSDKDNFRAKSSGNSVDLQTSKKIAMQNAKSEMAGLIQTTIKKVTDQYTQQRQIGNQQEFNNKFEELAREVTRSCLKSQMVLILIGLQLKQINKLF
jgi:flagellar motor switch protein FliM